MGNNINSISLFSIYDAKAQAYLQPFFSNNIETAKREFTKAVNGDGSFNQFAEDYALFYFGDFNQMEGTFHLQSTPQHCCNAITLKTPAPFAMTNGTTWPTKETTNNG